MKRVITAIFLIVCFSQINAQNTPRKLLGLDPATGRPGYIWLDTLRTTYYKAPLVATGPYGDTVTVSGSTGSGGQWKQFNSGIHYDSGFVGINTGLINPPAALLEIVTSNNITTPVDTSGIILRQPNAATNSLFKYAPSLTWEPQGWNTTTSATQKERVRFTAVGTSGGGGGYPIIALQVAKDTVNYVNVWYTSGTQTTFAGNVSGIAATFSQQVTAANFAQGGSGNTTTNNLASSGVGQLSVGLLPAPTYPEAIFAMYSNGSQGMLLPVMTSSERDSVNQQIDSVTITNGGSGYTSAPTINIIGGTKMNGIGPGSSATAALTAVLTGGSVTSATIVRPGAYKVRPTITFTGGGGSGATGTLVMKQSIHEGFIFYNSTIHAIQEWDGTSWQTLAGSTSGTAAPTTTPTSVGQQFVDTNNKKIYLATGTSSSSDWTLLN